MKPVDKPRNWPNVHHSPIFWLGIVLLPDGHFPMTSLGILVETRSFSRHLMIRSSRLSVRLSAHCLATRHEGVESWMTNSVAVTRE
jgi:hypothetical protein